MALASAYTQNYGQIADFLKTIQQGQAPDQFTVQHLKDLGYSSSNHRALIPLMKALGFLSQDGQPTQRYHEYRDGSQARRVMGEALKEAYADLFVLRAHPTEADKAVIEGKFKSSHNTSPHVAELMTKTFYALLALADLQPTPVAPVAKDEGKPAGSNGTKAPAEEKPTVAPPERPKVTAASLNYNIEIHLPATKDVEVFNAIFKSLKEHLID